MTLTTEPSTRTLPVADHGVGRARTPGACCASTAAR